MSKKKDGSQELIWSGSSRRKTKGTDGMVTGFRVGGESRIGNDDDEEDSGPSALEAFGVEATQVKENKPKPYRRSGRFKVTIEQ